MKSKLLKSILVTAVAGMLTVGCDLYVRQPAGEVEVSSAPPPIPVSVDVATPMPGPDYVWIGGAWDWGPDSRWVWRTGHWDRPPHPGAVWHANRYDYRNGHHVFVRGGWR